MRAPFHLVGAGHLTVKPTVLREEPKTNFTSGYLDLLLKHYHDPQTTEVASPNLDPELHICHEQPKCLRNNSAALILAPHSHTDIPVRLIDPTTAQPPVCWRSRRIIATTGELEELCAYIAVALATLVAVPHFLRIVTPA